jgi:hypothetical protein
MKTLIPIITLLASTLIAPVLSAQEQPAVPAAVKEHEWLKRFVGQWDLESGGTMEGKGLMKSSMLGDLWVVNSSDHEVGDIKMKSIQMICYDVKKKKYVGIWADSYMNHMWHYEGAVDKSGSKLILDAKGPNMADPEKRANYRDSYEFTDKDTIIATSSMQDKDGKWTVIMHGKAKRRT